MTYRVAFTIDHGFSRASSVYAVSVATVQVHFSSIKHTATSQEILPKLSANRPLTEMIKFTQSFLKKLVVSHLVIKFPRRFMLNGLCCGRETGFSSRGTVRIRSNGSSGITLVCRSIHPSSSAHL